jgi:hypothetical protein
MEEDVYFEGDPAVDSRRRHLERVLKGTPRRRWPWIAALLAGGGAWALWRAMQPRTPAQPPPEQSGASEPSAHGGGDAAPATSRRDR